VSYKGNIACVSPVCLAISLTVQKNVNAILLQDGGARLARDRSGIAEAFPGLAYQIDEAAGRVILDGTITLAAECGIPTRLAVRVEFPATYPQGEPRVFEVAGRFPHVSDLHFFEDRQCCL
jgi:hypothetical protein